MDLVATKAELKAWEREFKSQHGRDPSKADIKAVPAIGRPTRPCRLKTRQLTPSILVAAEKYRLYSKARSDKPAPAPSSSKAHPAGPPVTPSKRTARPQEDSFKTPSRSSAARSREVVENGTPNGTSHSPAKATQFAYAPSPSRLRALAASRSFSGSPNKKGGLGAQEALEQSSEAPINLGKTVVLPPTIDTPRTKAKRWLAGDAVSPPAKLRYDTQLSSNGNTHASTSGSSQPKQKHLNAGKADFWQQVEQRRSATPADDMETMNVSNGKSTESNGQQVIQEGDDDFLAPSPVKPGAAKLNGKGKQRQRVDLFGNSIGESSTANDGSLSQKDASNMSKPNGKNGATPITSFFSAKPSSTRLPSSNGKEESKSTYIPGPSKPRKRTIATAAIIPRVAEDFDKINDPDGAPVQTGVEAKPKKYDKKAGKQKAKEDMPTVTPAERAKRLRTETSAVEEDDFDAEMEDVAALYEAEANEQATAEQEDDDYETRDLSDEYEEYKPRPRSVTPAQDSHAKANASAIPLDDSVDPELVSLLSLKASPVKNRLAKLHKKREETYRKLLLEPTYIMETKRQITGLEDLEDEERRKREEETDNFEEQTWTTELEDDYIGPRKAQLDEDHEEQSDDDWASEPEGWKDLSDGEMPEDPF